MRGPLFFVNTASHFHSSFGQVFLSSPLSPSTIVNKPASFILMYSLSLGAIMAFRLSLKPPSGAADASLRLCFYGRPHLFVPQCCQMHTRFILATCTLIYSCRSVARCTLVLSLPLVLSSHLCCGIYHLS